MLMHTDHQHQGDNASNIFSQRGLLRISLFMALLALYCSVTAQTTSKSQWQWPVVGSETGRGILSRPQDYIGQELNFSDLFIYAPEGTTVVAPASGVVQSIGLSYYQSLTSVVSYNYTEDFDTFIQKNQEQITKRLGPIRYLSASITIKIADGRKVTVSGLRPRKRFATGERLQAGDTLGTILYAYHKIPQPCIKISVSNPQGRGSDPMGDFGLKSTFKPAKSTPLKATLSQAEATADLRQLASAIREMYPSLTDLMSYEDYDRWIDSLVSNIPSSMSRSKFGDLLTRFNRRIHDSHLYIDLGVDAYQPELPEIIFGKLGDKVIAYLATERYKRFVGKEITAIGGKPVAQLTEQYINEMRHLYDLSVSSWLDRRLALYYAFSDGVRATRKSKTDPLSLTFASGETVQVKLLDQKRNANPFGEAVFPYIRVSNVNRYREGYSLKELNDTTAYVGLSTFDLNEVDTQTIIDFIQEMRRKDKPALIIDLRNNPGGNVDCLYPILSEVLPQHLQKRSAGYLMVNASKFKTPTLNYDQDTPIFEDYRPIEGKRGLYLYQLAKEASTTPNDTASQEAYKGRVYVIIDSGSASASTEFAGNIKHSGRGIILGRETASSYHFFTALKFASIQLQHSQYGASIPLVRCVFDEEISDKFPAGRGVIPDIELPISLEELQSPDDYLLRRVLERIHSDLTAQP